MTREDKYTRDVKGYEGLYRVNALGEVFSVIGGDVGNISRCLNTDKSDTHKGFHFERVV